MSESWKLLFACLLTSGTIACLIDAALAQSPVADLTLGRESSVVTPDGTSSFRITGGATRGENLLHSFEQFNIGEGQSVYFVDSGGINNILARVTNGRSQIDGTLGVLGDANLFLLNPEGIIFGRNARLDLRGSFVASTADRILFNNGEVFSADLQAPLPLLTISVPTGLQYGAQLLENIRVEGSLEVDPGESLILAGGRIELDDGNLLAPGGQVDLAAIGGVGTLRFFENQVRLQSIADDIDRADVMFTNGAFVDVRAENGGEIRITAQNLSITETSGLIAGILDSAPTGFRAGNVEVNALGEVRLRNNSFISNRIFSENFGEGGDIVINTRVLRLEDGSQLNTVASGGIAGDISVNADRRIDLSGDNLPTGNAREAELIPVSQLQALPFDGSPERFASAINTSLFQGGEGQGGNIEVTASQIVVDGGAALVASTFGEGNAGNITLNALDRVWLDGEDSFGFASTASSRVETGARGNGGTIFVNTDRLLMTRGAEMTVTTTSRGNAGDIRLNVQDSIRLSGIGSNGFPTSINSQVLNNGVGSGGTIVVLDRSNTRLVELADGAAIQTRTLREGRGRGGVIEINTDRLIVQGGSRITTETRGRFAAGDVFVNAIDRIDIRDSSTITASAEAAGRGGAIEIVTDRIDIRNGSNITASATGSGAAGSLDVEASGSITVTGGRFESGEWQPSSLNFNTTDAGNAGRLDITAGQLIVRDGASVSASTTGAGDGGIIIVRDSDRVEVRGTAPDGTASQFSFETRGSGNADGIRITTGQLLVRDRGLITVSSDLDQQAGDPGSIEVEADSIELRNNASLTATANEGDGGSIRLQAEDDITLRDGSSVSTTAIAQGIGGNITVSADNLFLSDRANLITNTGGRRGGEIEVRVDDSVVLRNESLISTSAPASGDGGSIDIEAPNGFVLAVLPENSDIVAGANAGDGGRAEARAVGVFGFREFLGRRTPESDFTAASELGIDGVEIIDTEEREIPELPDDIFAPQIAQACNARGDQPQSEFTVTGSAGLPTPDAPESGSGLWEDLRPTEEAQSIDPLPNSAIAPASVQPIVEAQGWVIDERGEVVLVAQAPVISPQSPPPASIACPTP